MRSFFRDVLTYFLSPMAITAWVVVCVIVTVSGPFGTFTGMTLSGRAIYWPVLITIAFFTAYVIKVAVWRVIPRAHYLTASLTTALTFTVVFTCLFWFYTSWISYGQLSEYIDVVEVSTIIASITLGVTTVRHMLGMDHLENELSDKNALPRLMERLPSFEHETIQRLTVNDHFVEVHFSSGNTTRVRMRLSDAVREMDGVDGFLVHRSHWVARSSVATLNRSNGRYFVSLIDGTELPVGRKNKHNLDYLTAESGTG